MSTTIHIQRSDDIYHETIATFMLEAIPRVGEYIELPDYDNGLSWIVRSVRHRFSIEHIVVLTVSLFPEPLYHLDLVWKDETERPEWLPEHFLIECDYIPRRGELIDIGLVEEAFFKEAMLKGGETAVPADRFVTVEVVAIQHGCFCEQTAKDREAGVGFADLQSEMVVRRVTRGRDGDAQRHISFARRN